jgi:hypothetical protein
VGTNGSWSTPVTLVPGANSIVAKDTDAAGNTGASAAMVYTLDTVAPTVTITSAGGSTSQASQTISGTVTAAATGGAPTGTTVSLYDNGSTTALATAPVGTNGSWSAPVTLSPGANSIVANLPPTFTVADTAAHIQALTVAQINVLGQEGVTDLDATDRAATLTSAQTTALNNAGITVDPFA